MKDNTSAGASFRRKFDYTGRGSTLGTEIQAGLLMGILSVCGMFMTMNLMLQTLLSDGASSVSATAGNGEVVAQLYFITMLLGAAGSFVMGLVSGMPIVQASGLGLGAVLVGLGGVQAGLTYYNLLAVSLVSALVCTVVFAIPGLWQKLWNAIPKSVRKALPAALGVLLAWTAMQLTGIILVKDSAIPNYGEAAVLTGEAQNVMTSGMFGWSGFSYATDQYHPQLLLNSCGVVLVFAVYCFRSKRSRHPLMEALLTGTVFFLLANVCFVCVNWKNFGMSLDSMWGRLWTVGSEDAQQAHLFAVFSNYKPGRVLTEGFDFSQYQSQGGNVALLFVTGSVTMVLVMMLDAGATLSVLEGQTGDGSEKAAGKILLTNALCGVASPLLGGIPLSLSKTSVAGARDGAKTGVSAMVAGAVCLLSAFFWIVPFLFGTVFSYDIRFAMYGHYGAVLDILRKCAFSMADGVMVIVGISMVARSFEACDTAQKAVSAVTVAAAFFLSSLVGGAAVGILAWLLLELGEKKKISASRWITCAAAAAVLVMILR